MSVMYITVGEGADLITRMFWEDEKQGAPGPVDNIRKTPP
jgi:hypothetical protein